MKVDNKEIYDNLLRAGRNINAQSDCMLHKTIKCPQLKGEKCTTSCDYWTPLGMGNILIKNLQY